MTATAQPVQSFCHPLCDRGTALAVYWCFSEIVKSRKCESLSERESLENWGIGLDLVEEIERRYLSGLYQSSLFRFNPLESWTLIGLIRVLKDNDSLLPFPVQMLIPTEGPKIEKEWLV